MGMTAPHDSSTSDSSAEELLGAYALDALEPDEVAVVEALLARRPDLAEEAERLVRTAAWLGATSAVEARPELRAELLGRARRARPADADDMAPGADGAVRAYRASTDRLADTFAGFDPDAFDVLTPNGLAARDLVVHLAAQESMLAQAVDRTVVDDIRDDEIEVRTASFVTRYRDVDLDEVTEVWRRSIDEVVAWAQDPASRETTVPWLGLEMPRDNFLVARAFENWIHRDDLRRAQGLPPEAPAADDLHEMATLSMRTLPFALLVTDRGHPGKTARVVLTGPGGGEWTVSMGGRTTGGRPTGGGRVEAGTAPDVTLTADVVEWCLVAGERLMPEALPCSVEGDRDLAADLIAAAPAFATL
jgi:uncharacterized protein (TIGR03083 family)